MKSSNNTNSVFIAAFLLILVSSQWLCGQSNFKLVSKGDGKLIYNGKFEANGSSFDIKIEAKRVIDENEILDSKVSCVIFNNGTKVWDESLNGKYTLKINKSAGNVVISNFIATETKSNKNWTILMRSFSERDKEMTFGSVTSWVIIANGRVDNMKLFDDRRNYDFGKDYNVLKSKDVNALLVKIGSIVSD